MNAPEMLRSRSSTGASMEIFSCFGACDLLTGDRLHVIDFDHRCFRSSIGDRKSHLRLSRWSPIDTGATRSGIAQHQDRPGSEDEKRRGSQETTRWPFSTANPKESCPSPPKFIPCSSTASALATIRVWSAQRKHSRQLPTGASPFDRNIHHQVTHRLEGR